MPPEDWMRKREERLDRSRSKIRYTSRFGHFKIVLLMVLLAVIIKIVFFPEQPVLFWN